MSSVDGVRSEVYQGADLPDMPVDRDESVWRVRRADTLAGWALEAAASEDPAVLARAQVWATLAGAEWQAAHLATHQAEDADPTTSALLDIVEAVDDLGRKRPWWIWRVVNAIRTR